MQKCGLGPTPSLGSEVKKKEPWKGEEPHDLRKIRKILSRYCMQEVA